jgi:hypothetical protein
MMPDDHEEALAVFADGVCRLLKFEKLNYPDERMAGSNGSCRSKPDRRTAQVGRGCVETRPMWIAQEIGSWGGRGA